MGDRTPAEGETVASTGDSRTVNNTMRHAYRILGEDEKARMTEIKDLGAAFLRTLHVCGGTGEGERMASRELSLAQTKIEEAVMWAVKHVTK